jgi:HlyD family secretion protein
MSALTNPTIPPPLTKTPLEAPPPVKRKSTAIGWFVTLVILVLGGWVAYRLLVKPERPAAPVLAIRTAKVTSGVFERTVRISGQTAARMFANLIAPIMRGAESRTPMTLLTLIKNGASVKKGDEVATIDPSAISDHVDDLRATVLQAGIDVEKRRAEQDVEKENLRQTLRLDKSTWDKAKLDASASEVRTDIERELLKLAVEEDDARYKQDQLNMPEKEIGHQAEIKILQYTTERHKRHLGRHDADLQRFTMRSPISGLVVMQTTRKGSDWMQFQAGDEVYSGQALMKIVDLNSMQLEATVNQAESMEFRIGQKATILLDAFPEVRLSGRIYSIGALAVGGWRQNYYIRNIPVRIAIEGSDPKLIPDLSASADITLERIDKATLVPLNAIRREGERQFVEVKQADGGFARRDVQIGSTNNLAAVVLSGLSEGDEVRVD